MKDRKKRNIFIIVLSCMLVFIGLGYAVLSSTLTITSTSNVAGSWNVQLTSITKSSSIGSAISNSTSINSDGLGGTVSNTFTAPGESITYDVKVENKGKIDAVINIDLPEADSYYLFSTTFIDDTSLKSNNEYTFQITITYDEDAIDAPSGTSNHSFIITAEQDNSSSSKENSYIHLVDDEADIDEIGTEIAIGDEHFYVISSDLNTVTMLAKYNLLVGSVNEGVGSGYNIVSTFTPDDEGYNLQYESDDLYVTNDDQFISSYFSHNHYWIENFDDWPYKLKQKYNNTNPAYVYDENSNLYNYLQSYKTILENNIVIDEIRPISYQELIALNCETSGSCENAPSWVTSTNYWIGNVENSSFYSFIYVIFNNNISLKMTSGENGEPGVRPVITINKSYFD